MNILIIEDNQLKRERIIEFLASNNILSVKEAASYNSGLSLALSDSFDFMIIDMSMPTFDRTGLTHGGRFRAVGGKEIVVKLGRASKLTPFVIITGYKDFSVNSRSLTIGDIDVSLREFGDKYKGYIVYDVAESVWKDKLADVLKGI